MSKHVLTYPSVTASEEKMFDDVLMLLQAHGIYGNLQDNFLLAVSEAFTNALIHGNKHEPHRKIKILLDINKDSVGADIIDEGQGGLDKVKQRRLPTLLSASGRGVDIMQHYASVVSFTETAHGGLRVSIRFDLKKNKKYNVSYS